MSTVLWLASNPEQDVVQAFEGVTQLKVVVTDGQSTNWNRIEDRFRAVLIELPAAASVIRAALAQSLHTTVPLPVVIYDNAPDAFVEERARTQVDSKIGYIDRKLRVVIPPRYDWGFPFERGKAVVCSGCAQKRDGGEHWFVEGGMWGAVDRNGREIVPLQYRSGEELPK